MAKAKGQQHQPDPATWSALKSFTAGLYDEMDKLSKKAPSATVSDLGLNRVNRAIRQAKDLMGAFDVYAAELCEFVPAGDNPEVRDALLVLREITQALERVDGTFGLNRQVRGY